MKKFTKLFLSCAAVAAVTAAVATSAMAADLAGVQYATDKNESGAELATGTVTITLPTEFKDATKTLLILKPGADKTKIEPAKILQIGQDAYTGKVTAKVEALSADNADQTGTYTVLMGGTEGVIYEGSFYVGNGQPIKVGDVTGEGDVDSMDATCVLYYDAGLTDGAEKSGKIITVSDGSTAKVGDVTGEGDVDSMDATCILYYDAGLTDGAENAGTEITGTISE